MTARKKAKAKTSKAPGGAGIIGARENAVKAAGAQEAAEKHGAGFPIVGIGASAGAHLAALQRELRAKEEYLRAANEELETAKEELQSVNEELRAAQAELDAARARYLDLYDLAPAGYFTVSEKGLILEANLTAAALLGAARGALVKKLITRFIFKEDQDIYYLHRKQLFETGAPQTCEVRMVKKDGASFWARLEAAAAPDAGGAPVCRLVLCDITGRKRVEETLRERNEELSRFVYAVSHDLKSPLVTIKTFIGYLEEQDIPNRDSAAIAKDFSFINTAADKMSRLLDELLALSRVGRNLSAHVEMPLRALLEEALALAAGRLSERGIETRIIDEMATLFGVETVAVSGDRQRMLEVFQNLFDNAAKFMGTQPNPVIETGVDLSGTEPVFFVRDNGMGLDPRHADKIFGLFEKLEHNTEGVGMGLALTRKVIETHGGRIWAESEGPGRGTTFRFTLANTKKVTARVDRL